MQLDKYVKKNITILPNNIAILQHYFTIWINIKDRLLELGHSFRILKNYGKIGKLVQTASY